MRIIGSRSSSAVPLAVLGEPISARPAPPAAPIRHVLRGRLAAVSVRAAMAAGAWIGFALGLVVGAVLGALLCWFADAALSWQRDLGLTLGVAQNLLPLGDQIPALRTIEQLWYAIIPGTGLLFGVIGAILAALVAGLVAAGYNRASRHALVLVELPEAEIAAEALRTMTSPLPASAPGRAAAAERPVRAPLPKKRPRSLVPALSDGPGTTVAHVRPYARRRSRPFALAPLDAAPRREDGRAEAS